MPEFPALPSGLVARPLTPDDVQPVAELLAAAEPVDRTGEHVAAADLAEFWFNDLVDLPRDGRAVCSPGGDVVGSAPTIAPLTFRDAFGVHLEGRVHPDPRGRGIGRALLAWQLDRGAEIHAERHPEAHARLTVTAHTTMTSLEGLLRRAGLEQLRWFFHMERPLGALPVVQPVEGVELVPFSRDRDEELLRGGAVVGYVLAYVYESDTVATGVRTTYFGQIGVLPQARSLGLSRSVIAQALQVAAVHDCQAAALQVDAGNASGAHRLYEGLGFETTHTQVSWSRRIAALTAR